MKTVDFSGTIEACDLKVGRYSLYYMTLRRYVSIEGQGHFLTLAQSCVCKKIQTYFSQKLLSHSEPNFV